MAEVKEKGKRSVQYGVMDVQDSLPAKPVGQTRPSPLMMTVQGVMEDPALVGKAVCIAVYDSKTACGAAANVLRQRFGRSAIVRGVEFATRKHTVTDPETGKVVDKHGLWLINRPDQIVPGEWEKHEAAEAARLNKLAEAAAAKKAAEGNGASGKPSEAAAPANGGKGQKVPTKG
jgi:hypothetical protein